MSLQPYQDYYYHYKSSTYPYLLINGDKDRLDQVVQHLEQNRIKCIRTGPSQYPVRGMRFQWFIRIENERGGEPSFDVISRLMVTFSPHFPQPAPESQRLEAELLAARQQAEQHAQEAHEKRQALEKTLSELNKQKEISSKDKEIFEAFVREHDEREARVKKLETEIVILSAHRDELLAKLQEHNAPAVATDHNTNDTNERDLIEELLNNLIPQVCFLRDSVDVIAFEFTNRRSVLTKLGQLALNKVPSGEIKKVRRLEDWLEVHCSTGQGDGGRIYFRRKGERVDVLVSQREEQERDINWLSAQQ